MIYISKTENSHIQHYKIIGLYYLSLIINKVAYGYKTVWELISSCFGSGIWHEDSNWIESEIWKNN